MNGNTQQHCSNCNKIEEGNRSAQQVPVRRAESLAKHWLGGSCPPEGPGTALDEQEGLLGKPGHSRVKGALGGDLSSRTLLWRLESRAGRCS